MDVIHGGDIAGYQLRHGRVPVDFSASLNPCGMPAAVRAAAHRAVDGGEPYPDPLCRRLAAALREKSGVPEAHQVWGNGAADLIHRFVQALRPATALVLEPAFAEYERALRTTGCAIAFHQLKRETSFRLDENLLAAITPGLDVLFLCQPNNPTGQPILPGLLRRALSRCAETGTTLFLDESFRSFVDEPERHSLLGSTGDFPNLFVLDSFTKVYAMAGLRLGFGVSSNSELMGRMRFTGQPWSVSTVAQEAGLAALGEDGYVRTSLAVIREEKEYLAAGLGKLGLEVIGCAANYLFFRSDIPDLPARLEEKGILIRDCANFRGLEAGYCRIAVRLRSDNEALLRAVAETREEAWRKPS